MYQLPKTFKRVLITGGAGFIGGTLVRHLLGHTSAKVFNLDKIGYCSDLVGIQEFVAGLGSIGDKRYQLLKVDLSDEEQTAMAVKASDPDLVFHLAAESHVDRSIDNPDLFVKSNINGTFNLLKALRSHWERLPTERKDIFRMHHISTDEVFGSLGSEGQFWEGSPYSPRSPYSASKAASDHLVQAWYHTYGLPGVITNCSNNYGPWQFPDKLIPLVILKAIANEPIPLYGDGKNVRDWLYVEDHIEAILLSATRGKLGSSYCIGGGAEKTNKNVIELICKLLDVGRSEFSPHSRLISFVGDRPGHDRRYAINFEKIKQELDWRPKVNFEKGLSLTVSWYIKNINWAKAMLAKSNYNCERIGIIK